MPTKPTKFYAQRDCSHDGHSFATGDEIPAGRALAALLEHGDTFAAASKPKASATDSTPNVDDVGQPKENNS